MCSDAFGCIRMRSDTFGCVRMRSEVSETFWEFSGENLYSVDDSERFRRFSEVFGRVRMHSDAFGSFWKLPKIFSFFDIFFEDFGILQTWAYQNYSKVLL